MKRSLSPDCSEKRKKKTKTVEQKYRREYSNEWPVLTKSAVSEKHVLCTACNLNFLVSHGGRSDCWKHIQTEGHRKKSAAVGSSTLKNFFPSSSNSDNAVINAEVLFTNFIVEHNIPIAVTDHAAPLFKQMFPDSNIAKKYGCARTKTTAIIRTLGEADDKSITGYLKEGPFSLAIDGSTDLDSKKLYPVIVKYYDKSVSRVNCGLLSLVECDLASTGENIFKILDNELTSREIPWGNCLSFTSDNASVMMGSKKGVAAFVLKKQPNVHIVGCACHLMDLASKRASHVLPCAVDDCLVDIYYYLHKSSERQQSLILFQKLNGNKVMKILKHVQTRWLSLRQCISRLLDQWEPLQQFFEAEKEKPSKGKTKKQTGGYIFDSCFVFRLKDLP